MDNNKPLFKFKHNQQKNMADLTSKPTNSQVNFKHHRGRLWKDNKKT